MDLVLDHGLIKFHVFSICPSIVDILHNWLTYYEHTVKTCYLKLCGAVLFPYSWLKLRLTHPC